MLDLEEVLEDPNLNNEEYLNKRTLELFKLPDEELKDLGEKGKEKKEKEDEKEIKQIRGKHYVQ